MASVEVTGRVVSVRPRDDGTFGVTLGPGPSIYWYRWPEPPSLGAQVAVEASRSVERRVLWGGREGRLHVLSAVTVRVHDDVRAARVVAPEWLARVEQSMARPPYRYQVEGAAWVASRFALGLGSILADAPGIGKTTQGVASLCATGLFPAIVVCPMAVKVHWVREFEYAAYPPSCEIVSKKRGALAGADVVIINYDLLRYWEETLGRMGARAIIFDEGQVLKEPRPRTHHRAAVATRLARYIARALVLTGTPMMNLPIELWRLLHIADPGAWPSLDAYVERYCRAPTNEEEATEAHPQRRVVTSHGRVERVDELWARMQETTLRRQKSEVLVDLPSKSRRTIMIELAPEDMHQYRAAQQNVVAWLTAQGAGLRAQRATKAQALVKLQYLRRLAALGKLRALPEILAQSFGFGSASFEQLLIFAYHRDVVEGAAAICRALGARVAGIRGDDAFDVRQAAIDSFTRGEADVFVAPIKAAGTGLDGLQCSSQSLFLERTWVPSEMEQAEDRQHRLGQLRPVVATYLDAAGTVDEHIAAVVIDKRALITPVVDNRMGSEEDAFAVIEEVAWRLRPAAA